MSKQQLRERLQSLLQQLPEDARPLRDEIWDIFQRVKQPETRIEVIKERDTEAEKEFADNQARYKEKIRRLRVKLARAEARFRASRRRERRKAVYAGHIDGQWDACRMLVKYLEPLADLPREQAVRIVYACCIALGTNYGMTLKRATERARLTTYGWIALQDKAGPDDIRFAEYVRRVIDEK